LSAGHHGHDLGHGADVGAAQDRVGPGDGTECGGHDRCAGEADGCACNVQPAVGFLGQVMTSPGKSTAPTSAGWHPQGHHARCVFHGTVTVTAIRLWLRP
jgi:hypothetical protein